MLNSELAQILMNGQKFINTAWGRKSPVGVADMIYQECQKQLADTSTRLLEKAERANSIQHSGGKVLPEDWSELYALTNELRAVLNEITTPTK